MAWSEVHVIIHEGKQMQTLKIEEDRNIAITVSFPSTEMCNLGDEVSYQGMQCRWI